MFYVKFFSMKNINYIINGVLIVAVIVLFILQLTGGRSHAKNSGIMEALTDSTGIHLPVAYIRTDSLLANYKFSTDLNEAYIKKVEDKKLTINQRTESFRKQVLEYQQKAQQNAFYNQERQAQEESRLQGLQRDLENYSAQVERELSIESAKMQQQLFDTIVSAVKKFNNPRKYQLILSNVGTDNLYYADDSYDITKEVIDFLNARYVPSK